MNFFSLLKGGRDNGGAEATESTGLLSDWAAYHQSSRDVEAGGSTSSSLFKSVESSGAKAVSSINGLLQSSYETVSKGVSSGVAALPTTESFSIPSGQQLTLFFSFLAAGVVFLLLAFLLFLPMIVLTPSKFAMSFTIGCLCIMAGFSALRGWKQQAVHMTSKERLPFTAAYLSSIVATLYVALIVHSYILSLVCSGLQMVALLYYVFSYFPGGAAGVRFLLTMFYNAVSSCFGALLKR